MRRGPGRAEHALDQATLKGVAVHVEPGAADDKGDVVREVEDGGDEGEGDEQEEERVCLEPSWLAWILSDDSVIGVAQGDAQKKNFSIGVKMYTLRVTSSW